MQIAIIEVHALCQHHNNGDYNCVVRVHNDVTFHRQDVIYHQKMEIECMYHGLKFIRDNSMKFGGIEWYSDRQFKGAFYHEDITGDKRVLVRRSDEEVKIKSSDTQQEN